MNNIELNTLQLKAINSIKKFIDVKPILPPDLKVTYPPVEFIPDVIDIKSAFEITDVYLGKSELGDEFKNLQREDDKMHNFLLLGPGGSGKTTVIVNAFNNSKKKVIFCAFTNKATQVLRNISNKFNINFIAKFMTFHKLLMLEPKHSDYNLDINFDFDFSKLDDLKNYDVIIFDECSIISKELEKYIYLTWEYIYFTFNKCLKFIFLGDYWQLSPVGEEKSILFNRAVKNNWTVAKLNTVIRSKNTTISSINDDLLKYVLYFKKNDRQIINFHKKYPYNLIDNQKYPDVYINNNSKFYEQYIDTWQTDPDVIILTYTRSNCKKTNINIQNILNKKNKRKIVEEKSPLIFYKGDRCCIERPVDVYTLEKKKSYNNNYIQIKENTGYTIYNGEIFDIIGVSDIKIFTNLNKFKYTDFTTINHNEYCSNCSLDTENSKRKRVYEIYKCNGHFI